MTASSSAAKTKPRAGIYVLGQAGAPSAGGSTSRMGADIAIPVTQTTSFIAAIHPDFSNVETDQQTIAPTTFARFYSEVRPFFAQGASYYDNQSCYGCQGWSELYTPAIPTPRDGYQIEGKTGPFTYGVLDAVGLGRIDDAQSLNYTTKNDDVNLSYTRVDSEQPDLNDLTNVVSAQFSNQKNIVGYVTAGVETGTNVLEPGRAKRFDAGIAYSTKDDFDAFTMRSVGSQWNPVDGFTAVNDIAGYSAQANHTFHLNGPISTVSVFQYIDKYAGSDGFGTNVYDTETQGTVAFKNNLQVQGNIGVDMFRVQHDPDLHFDTLQGARVDYLINTPQQSTFNYQIGRYGDGWLFAIDRIAGIRIARRATLSLEGYNTAWIGDRGRNDQWLDRANVTFDINHTTSFSIGARKLIGTPPPYPGLPAPLYTNATNLTFAFSRRRAHDDIFLVYGDPNTLSTTPALILKYVHYFGADRGT